MKILYVTSACNEKNINEYNKYLKTKLSYAHVKFHNLIIEGLIENGNHVTHLVGLPVSRNEKLLWKKDESKKKNYKYYQSSFLNIPIIKQLSICIGIFIQTRKWLKKNKDGLVILDMTYATVLMFIFNLFKKFKGKVIGISPDVYEYMADVKKITHQKKFISNITKKRLKKIYSKMDGYIFLTKEMNDIINFNNKPYLVMEGLVKKEKIKINNYRNREKIILYAGGLTKRFGIEQLINCFMNLPDKDLKLYLYGAGELESFIKEASIKDKRITFFGVKKNSEIVEMERKSYLLINPRNTDEYTRFSFPSKIMEYMLSGTIVLTTKLPGIPQEYDKYLYYINNLEEDIINILNTDANILEEKSSKAYDFVVKNKNNIIQAKKIIDFGGRL